MKIKIKNIINKIADLFGTEKKDDVQSTVEDYHVPFQIPSSSYKVLICPTGFGHTGSGTLLDYFSEFNNATVLGLHDNDFSGLVKEYDRSIGEIDFVRCAGGVMDIERQFNASTYFGDDLAVKMYLHIAEYFYRRGKIYNDYFWQLTDDFIRKIVDLKIRSKTGFEGLYFLRFFVSTQKKYNNIHTPLCAKNTLKRYIYYLKPLSVEQYQKIAKEYIVKFLSSIESKDFLVCDQFLTTSKPETDRKLKYVGPFKQIVVIRDPRDVYATAFSRKNTTWMAKNPRDFIKFFFQRGTPNYINAHPHPNRLLIRFEDFVLKYEEVCKVINDFVGIKQENHFHKREYFIPEISVKNIGLYKAHPRQEDIKYIEERLSNYCYYPEKENLSDEAWHMLKMNNF